MAKNGDSNNKKPKKNKWVVGNRAGIRAIADMCKHMDDVGRELLLANVAKESPELAEKIRNQIFVFEDIVNILPKELNILLMEVPSAILALAMRGASEEFKDKILKSMSRRGAEMLIEDIEAMGPQRTSEVQAARKKILVIAKQLETQGKILLSESKDSV